MLMQRDKKRAVLTILFILTIIWTFVALFFNLYKVKVEALGLERTETGTGFSVLEGNLEGIGAWLCIYTILTIIILKSFLKRKTYIHLT